jgi:uncharacterized membrane protein
MTSTGWFYWALLSAVFAALTAIFAKVGIQGELCIVLSVNSVLAAGRNVCRAGGAAAA